MEVDFFMNVSVLKLYMRKQIEKLLLYLCLALVRSIQFIQINVRLPATILHHPLKIKEKLVKS
ncbi:hypothetical protein Hanom_Chr15g01374991 [Helianthus anomalus]